MIFDRQDTMTAFYFVVSRRTNYPLNYCPCLAFLLTSFKCQGLSRLKKEKESVNNSTKELPAKLNFCWWLSMSQKSGYWWWSRYSQPCSSQDLLRHIFFFNWTQYNAIIHFVDAWKQVALCIFNRACPWWISRNITWVSIVVDYSFNQK